jgi:predicted dehydrogenase
MNMRADRVAIIGTGGIAGAHMDALAAMGDRVRAVAAMDVDRARVEAFCAAHGLNAYTDAGAMLDAEQPDLVHIAAPPGTHHEFIVQCLEAGAWVWCEKPLCRSLAELDSIARAERASGTYCSSVCQWRFGSGGEHLKTLIQTEALGRPLAGVCLTTWYRDEAYFQVPWRARWATAGGGPTLCLGIHLIDFFLWLLGDWQEVCAMAGTLDRPIEVEDISMASVRFRSGALGSIVNSTLSPRQETYLRLDFQRATVELKTLYSYANRDWQYTLLEHAGNGHAPAGLDQIPTERAASHTTQLANLLDSMERGERPAASATDVRDTIEFITCLYKAAATGRTVQRGTIGPDDPYYHHVAGQAIHGAAQPGGGV